MEDDEYRPDAKNYYSIAHSCIERVTEQASMMVNGKLKEYQVQEFKRFFRFKARVHNAYI